MNKYAAHSRRIQRRRKRLLGCDRKVPYPSRDAAMQKGQDVYHCRFCGQRHRTGSLAQLAIKIGRRMIGLNVDQRAKPDCELFA